jgi:hypothetical protein
VVRPNGERELPVPDVRQCVIVKQNGIEFAVFVRCDFSFDNVDIESGYYGLGPAVHVCDVIVSACLCLRYDLDELVLFVAGWIHKGGV